MAHFGGSHFGGSHFGGSLLTNKAAFELSLSYSGFTVVQKRVSVVLKPTLLIVVLITASLVTWSGSVHAQFFPSTVRFVSGRFVEVPRILQKQMREAEEAIEDARYNDAVLLLGDLMARNPSEGDEDELLSQDFFLDAGEKQARGTPLNKSYKIKIRDMIGGLPVAALDTYEIRYGPAAQKMLDQAAATRDWAKLGEVRRMYFHTQAGYDASWLLAQHEMFQGHPIAASALLDDIVILPRAINRLGKGVLVLHAAACKLANRKLPATLDGVSGQAGQVSIAGAEQTGPKQGELAQWLDQFYGAVGKLPAGQIENYLVYNASENRNGASSGQMPLSNVRWQLDTTVSPKQEREVKDLSKSLASSGQLPPPSWVPLKVGKQLLMRTTEYLVGVDYRTGKRIWLHPWSSTKDDDQTTEANAALTGGVKGNLGVTEFLRQRVWNDVPYGQVTSDGERVYLLDGLKKLNATGSRGFPMVRSLQPNGNSLIALELASEGTLKWFQGARSGADSPLADAFFLGPPLPIEGRLYVMCELAGDIFLLCLEPRTGKEIWRQQLVAVESGTITRDRIRRVAGAMLSYQDGVLICPTGAGALVAVNLGDRTLRWGVSFERNSTMNRFVQQRGAFDTKQLMQRWFSGTAIISDSSVLITPVESDRLLGFNLMTGKALFTQKIRLEMRYLAGIRGDNFYVVGPTVMKAYDLANGSQVWKTNSDVFAAGQQVSGQGVFGKDCYLLPTNSQEIIRVSLEDGQVLDKRKTKYELGNLVAVDGEIITQGPTKLSVAFGEATLVPLVERMLEENPENFDAIVRKADLLIQAGDFTEAIGLLAKARRVQPENDEVRMLSVSGMLEQFRRSGNFSPQQIEELSKLIDRPLQQVEFDALRLESAMAAEDYGQAALLLLELSELVVAEFNSDDSADRLVGENDRFCLLDAWINGRVRDYIKVVDPEVMQDFEAKLNAHLEGRTSVSSERVQRVLAHFNGMESAEQLRTVLADRYRKDREPRLLELTALGHHQPNLAGLRQLSTERLLMLADAYESGAMLRNLPDVLRELKSRTETLNEAVAKRIEDSLERTEQTMRAKDWPKNATYKWASQAKRRTSTSSQRVHSLEVQAGEEFRDWALISLANANRLQLRAPDGSLKTLPASNNSVTDKAEAAFVSGGVMVVQTTAGLLAMDLYRARNQRPDSNLWPGRDVGGAGSIAAKPESYPAPFGEQVKRYMLQSTNMRERPEFRVGPILGDRVIVLKGGELSAISLRTGDDIWRINTAPKSGMVLCDGERVAVVSSDRKQTVLFDIADGRELETQPFEYGELWKAAGNNVLCYMSTNQPNVYTVNLFNPFTGEVLLSQEANSSDDPNEDSTANVFVSRVFSGHYLTMMSPVGETFVWDLREGRELVRTQLAPQDELKEVRAILMRDRVVLLPAYNSQVVASGMPKIVSFRGEFHRSANAAFAFSLEDGSLLWSKKFEQPWGCSSVQPMETPVLVLTRVRVTYNATVQKSDLEVLALDARTGKVLAAPDPKSIPTSNNSIETVVVLNTAESKVTASIGQVYLINFDFADEGVEAKKEEESEQATVEVEVEQ